MIDSFTKMDKDNSGKLDIDEARAGLKNIDFGERQLTDKVILSYNCGYLQTLTHVTLMQWVTENRLYKLILFQINYLWFIVSVFNIQ